MSNKHPEDGLDLEEVASQTAGAERDRNAWRAYLDFIETEVAPGIGDEEGRKIYFETLTRTPKEPPKFSKIRIDGHPLRFPEDDCSDPGTIPSTIAALGPGEVPGPIALPPVTSEPALGGDVFIDRNSGPKGPEA
ncbi:MAG: hypothetical protein HY430_02480 [Candidatus Levybacteria bacterium]|nr:hypothetical protein [Candidatus Levybacteria bacterium]